MSQPLPEMSDLARILGLLTSPLRVREKVKRPKGTITNNATQTPWHIKKARNRRRRKLAKISQRINRRKS